MDAKFQASFIPKQPVTNKGRGSSSHVSIFSLISLIFFIVTIGVGGAAGIANYMLGKNIETLRQQLAQARDSFELSTIEELKKTERRLNQVRTILTEHIGFSSFFDLLEEVTYKDVAYTDFSYSIAETGALIEMQGIAKNLNILTIQSELFASLDMFLEQEFTGFSLDEKGSLIFKFSGLVDIDFINYKHRVVKF